MSAADADSVPDCLEVVRSLWDYLDRRLEPVEMAGIDEHLARCEGCRSHAEFEGRLLNAISELRRRHSDPARLRCDVLEVLRGAGLNGGRTR